VILCGDNYYDQIQCYCYTEHIQTDMLETFYLFKCGSKRGSCLHNGHSHHQHILLVLN
jgi:hypothetical protein